MRLVPRARTTATGLLLGGLVALGSGMSDGRAPEPSIPEGEVARIRDHLAGAEQELRLGNVAGLSAEQRAARARNVRWLQGYRVAGRFPHNHDFPGRLVPYFVDAHGTPCAMAYLIARSGRRDIVDAVVTKRNNATIHELAADPELGPALAAWLDEAGLTLDEAARVQPSYCGSWGPCPLPDRTAKISSSDAALTALSGGFGLASSLLNAGARPAGWHGVSGVAAGGLAMMLGAAQLDERGARGTLGLFNMTFGVVSTALGLKNLMSVGTRDPEMTAGHGLRAAPVLLVSGSGRPGVGLHLTF